MEEVIEVKLNLIILGVDSMQYLYLIVVAEKLVSSISAFLFVSGVISPTTFFLLNNFPEAGCLVFCFFGDVWAQSWFKLTKSMIQPYSFRNWMGPSLQFQAYAQYLEYSLGIFGCNVAFDDDRQQRIAQPRRFYWTIHTHRTTNVKNRE